MTNNDIDMSPSDDFNFDPAPETKSQLTCDCSKKVPLSGVAGKDYKVISTTSPQGNATWKLHADRSCYLEIMQKIKADANR